MQVNSCFFVIKFQKTPKRDMSLNFFYRVSLDSDNAYRMQPEGYEGYTLPMVKKGEDLFRYMADNPSSDDMIIPPLMIEDFLSTTLWLFNEGNIRLRQEGSGWITDLLKKNGEKKEDVWAVVKSHEVMITTRENKFFQSLINALHEHVILVLNADDLRRDGAIISRSLTWEQAVRDVVVLVQNRKLKMSSDDIPPHIVITFDFDAALYLHVPLLNRQYTDVKVENAVLVFSTSRSEGDFQSGFQGKMPGAQTVLHKCLCWSSTIIFR